MKKIKPILCFILSAIIAASVCGCNSDNSSQIIYYGMADTPSTVDPQLAYTSAELMIVRNLFEGLLRENGDGEIVNGVITDYEKNGLTYKFNIKGNAVWSDGTPLTANDFVFGLTRAVLPETGAPYADSLMCIKNAAEIKQGKLRSDALAVTAADDKTLIIELAFDDSDFLRTLTTSICMPCNKTFFEKSTGKYGMSYETVLANGSYKLRKWTTEDFAMRIIKNDKYTGDFKPKNAAVYFSKSKDYTNFESLKRNTVDITQIDAADVSAAKDAGYNTFSQENKIIVLYTGADMPLKIRKVLYACALSADDKSKNGDYKIADTVYPDIFEVNAPKINIFAPDGAHKALTDTMKELKLNEFPQTTIEYSGDDTIKEIAKTIAGHWQQYLGIYINVTQSGSYDTVKSNIKNKSNYIAVYTIEINQANMTQYLDSLGVYNNGNYESLQNDILENCSRIPLAFGFTYYASSKSLTGIKYSNTNGVIDFSYIVKTSS